MIDPPAVLFEDPHCLAVAKPAGILTQGRPGGERTLEDAVRRHLDPADPGAVYLGTVHRLDRPVSGVVVWAKTPKAARRLAEQFASRGAAKEYWTIVEGDAAGRLGPLGTWEDWLSEVDASGATRPTEPGTPGARLAVTRFRVGRPERAPEGTSWLVLRPETGRTHQLRAQAAARGLPILGDAAYGATRAFPAGIALHARALRVRHPVLRTPLTWLAPLPDAWAQAGLRLPEIPPF